MPNRTNSLTAAALSIGVDADLLQSILPDLQLITAKIREGNATTDGVGLLVWCEYALKVDGYTEENRSAHIIPLKQCGTPGAPPCTCGD